MMLIIEEIVNTLHDKGDEDYYKDMIHITKEQALEMLYITAYEEYMQQFNTDLNNYIANSEVIKQSYSQRELETMFDFYYNQNAKSEYMYDDRYIIFYYPEKDIVGATAAVHKHGNDGNRRRLNQMNLFFYNYDFLDKSDEELNPLREKLGVPIVQ